MSMKEDRRTSKIINEGGSDIKIQLNSKEDLVIEINNMNSFEELVNSLKNTGRSSLLLKIIRDDEQNWVTIKFKNN